MTIIDPQKVLTPADHGKVYCFKENVNELRWLYEGDVVSNHVKIATVADNLASFYNERLKLVTVKPKSTGFIPVLLSSIKQF